MEQSRAHGKSHWYHETQARNQAADVLPLVPEAAHFADRFLLDLTLPPFSARTRRWLELSRQISAHLFPDAAPVTRLNTFSAYERLSTALTVAQVFGVQRLCNHYAARLAPLPGPDSSRESNHRLAQITQYARQLASSPYVICAQSREQLEAVGLTAPDRVLITQIVGFISYQARVVAAGQALLGLPVRWIPGMPMQDDAPAAAFSPSTGDWQPGIACRGLTDNPEIPEPFVALLAWDEVLSEKQAELLQALEVETALSDLTALLCARINGSLSCFQKNAADASLKAATLQGDRALRLWQADNALTQATIQAVQLVTRAPDRFSAAQFSPLTEQGLSVDQAFTLLAWSGACGWINRLKIGLGEVSPDA